MYDVIKLLLRIPCLVGFISSFFQGLYKLIIVKNYYINSGDFL